MGKPDAVIHLRRYHFLQFSGALLPPNQLLITRPRIGNVVKIDDDIVPVSSHFIIVSGLLVQDLYSSHTRMNISKIHEKRWINA